MQGNVNTFNKLFDETFWFTWFPKIILAFLIFVVFWLVSQLIATGIRSWAHKLEPQRQQIFYLLSSTLHVAFIIIGGVTVLGSLGVNVSAIIASIGLSGLALSLAIKDTLSNIFAGIIIIIYQPFRVGDKIFINVPSVYAPIEGTVKELTLRYLHLEADDGEVMVPNSTLFTTTVKIFRK